ncbi:MAG TPA: nuclear transport factor 2 family protein [Ilumatobacteraceae bacterium]|nr:nuclear transport factor 2 family protein [Ilumatobacteraceae bacterium]
MPTTPLPTSPVPTTGTSPLDHPPVRFLAEPFFAETLTLLRSVRDHDFDTLAALCDDDFGIVDVDPAGAAKPIRDRAGWEAWFHELFATLTAMCATTDSTIDDYHAVVDGRLGYSVLEFTQTLTVGEHVATFECVATIIWKRTPDGWREARWHASVISSDVPAELTAEAGS